MQICSIVCYESIKRELNEILKFDSRCDARLKAEAEGCTRLALNSSKKNVSVVYYESLKRELKTKKIDGYRCDERLIKLT